jgi:transcriptional regulator with XRE-family HTH domain
MTQEDAAHAAGIDYKRWQRLEQGSVNPTVKTLERAALALGMSFWDLVATPPRKRKAAQPRSVTGSRASAPKRERLVHR